MFYGWLALYWVGVHRYPTAYPARHPSAFAGQLVVGLGSMVAPLAGKNLSLYSVRAAKHQRDAWRDLTVQSTGLIDLFAFLGQERGMERIGGGSETDVYRTDDALYVVKLKGVVNNSVKSALAQAESLRDAAGQFTQYLGVEYSIPTYFLVAQDGAGKIYTVGIQPYLDQASPLAAIDYLSLTPRKWAQVERQLLIVLRRALRCYKRTGHMPDLYGTFSRSVLERKQMNRPLMWPKRVWHFLTQRLWYAHNLLLTHEPQLRVVLVDYDYVRWRGLWGRLYYAICWLLFWRELVLLGGWEATLLIEEEFRAVG
jgi:hypothetical protein